ncbi:RbsD/FucU family protein [Granulosicoccus antarcticus]|uniref:RbsD/FucU family protein n=1 Tax=Granulosicoccus antarcticus TaxID=437505 RepID=UPI000B5A599C|nr:RbsD/FucU family protein [Granulosicoccus antarcticus]
MLKTINPLLNADILYALASMGHGDSIVLCDANFPGESVARKTSLGRLLRVDGASVVEVAEAVLSLMPLDNFIDDAAQCMEVVGAPDESPQVQREVQAVIDANENESFKLMPVERFAFYAKASSAYAVIASGERRFYGCFILTKGVLAPEA